VNAAGRTLNPWPPSSAAGGRAIVVEADLSDPASPAVLFDTAEVQLGPVDILVNNATGWLADTFTPRPADRLGRSLQPVSAAGWQQQFTVDARAAALLIAEFARRHIARGAGWGRIIGLTSGGDLGFPEEVSYGAAKAAQVNYTMSAALELAPYGVTANMVHPPVTDTGWVTQAVRDAVAASPTLAHVAPISRPIPARSHKYPAGSWIPAMRLRPIATAAW
jgi:3-oxoacyl-[acyl-carrier protein] reductase